MNDPARFAVRFEFYDTSRVCVVVLFGSLDPVAVEQLHPRIQRLVQTGYRRFVFDLSAVDHIGSLDLRLFVGLAQQLRAEGGLALCGPSEAVRAVADMTRLEHIVPILSSRPDAFRVVAGS